MKVRMLTTKAGPNGGWNAGDILDRPAAEDGISVPYEPAQKVEKAIAAPQREPEAVVEKRAAVEPEPEKKAPAPVAEPRRHVSGPKDHSRRK